MSEVQVRSFAFVVDGDVIGTLHVPSSAPNSERLSAGLSSGAVSVECTDVPGVQFGWTYDGNSFVAPQG